MPALGTHNPMTEVEIRQMFGSIPSDRFLNHDWRNGTVKVGQVPAEYVNEISNGYMEEPIDVEINKVILDKKYDLIISIGQVVPHEIVGFVRREVR